MDVFVVEIIDSTCCAIIVLIMIFSLAAECQLQQFMCGHQNTRSNESNS